MSGTPRTAYPATETNGDTLTTTNFDKLPGGWIGYAEITSSSNTGVTTGTSITGLDNLVVTLNTSRRVKISAGVGWVQNTSAGRIKLYITEGGTTIRDIANNTTASGEVGVSDGSVIRTGTGSKTYSLNVAAAGGATVDITATSNDAPGPGYLLIEDIGPS